MTRGPSTITSAHRLASSRYHRLYAAWSFNFHLVAMPGLFSIPPALCRVVLQLSPSRNAWPLLDTTGFMPRGPSVSASVSNNDVLESLPLRLKLRNHTA